MPTSWNAASQMKGSVPLNCIYIYLFLHYNTWKKVVLHRQGKWGKSHLSKTYLGDPSVQQGSVAKKQSTPRYPPAFSFTQRPSLPHKQGGDLREMWQKTRFFPFRFTHLEWTQKSCFLFFCCLGFYFSSLRYGIRADTYDVTCACAWLMPGRGDELLTSSV